MSKGSSVHDAVRRGHPLLADLRVLEIEPGIAGAYCGRLLADCGAEVVKVEPPSGDSTRTMAPLPDGREDPELSSVFLYLNAAKLSIVLDVDRSADRLILDRLIGKADVVIDGLRPSRAEEMDLGRDAYAIANPLLVWTSITPFGKTGPYRDFEASGVIVDALAGGMYIRGERHRPPVRMTGESALYTAGIAGFTATLGAVYGREVYAQGQSIDVSALEALCTTSELFWAHYAYQGLVLGRGFVESSELPGRMKCSDGDVMAFIWSDAGWESFPSFIGDPRLLEDPRFATGQARARNAQALRERLAPWFARRSRQEVFTSAQEWRLPFGYFADAAALLEDEQNQERRYFLPMAHPGTGTILAPGAPFRFSDVPRTAVRAAPFLGEHQGLVLQRWLGQDDESRRGTGESK